MTIGSESRVKNGGRGDENKMFLHALLTLEGNVQMVQGIMLDSVSNFEPKDIKSTFLDFYKDKFNCHDSPCSSLQFTDLLKHDIQSFVVCFFSTGMFLQGSNLAFITLIPKVSNPLFIKDYRPISLIGIHYKIVAKILANRLSKIINSIISLEHFAFITGRQILDGPLILSETIDWYKKRKKKMMLFKVDFEKAFDFVSEGLHMALNDDVAANMFHGVKVGSPDGLGLTVISDSHKGLIEAVKNWLANAEHRHCCRHICKLKKQMNWHCAAFENGISESFNGKIMAARGKPIITMLEDIRVYVMQRNWNMSKQASELQDQITPSIRKRLDHLKVEQRKWQVFASGYQVAEVRRRDHAFGVNLITRSCDCRLWTLTGVPCAHAVAAYMKQKIDPDLGVSNSYSQSKWFDTYKFSIKPVYGYKMWKPTRNTPPLPPIVKTIPRRPRKNRIKHPSEQEHEHSVSRAATLRSTSRGRGSTSKVQAEGRVVNKHKFGRDQQAYGVVGSTQQGGGSTSRGGGSTSRGASSSSRGGRVISRGGYSSKRGGISTSIDSEEYQYKKDIQAEREVMQETMLEERKKQEEREHNGRIYTKWDDLMVNLVSGGEFMDTRPTLSKLAAVDEAIAEHNQNQNI
ncbi:RNA-directed DNA polymerase, eukaryota, reverse transcriptase zinc-binding domain protein [Tanacetum coccineum]